MGAFTTISGQAFRAMQFSAGVLLRDFDPANPPAALTDSMILCATSGGVSAQCTPTYEDLGEDVDNCPKNTMELKKLIGWDCKLSFTALETTLEVLALALGAADSTTATGRVKPRATLSTADFGTVWWVGDRFDGGFAAIRLDNALGGGFELQTTDKGKGQISVELTGHGSMSDPEAVPMASHSSFRTSHSPSPSPNTRDSRPMSTVIPGIIWALYTGFPSSRFSCMVIAPVWAKVRPLLT